MIAEAFIAACRTELAAPKPGNVHVFADGHRMTVDDFLVSADAASEPLSMPGASVGRRIFEAVAATHHAAGSNTNLGIILLCAPLARASELRDPLAQSIKRVLRELSREDAEWAFKAIALARPAGLGTAPVHDVNAIADCTLLEAMAAASDRDRIAYAYISDFEDILSAGLARHRGAVAQGGPAWWPATAVFLGFLATIPDTHVARKHGQATALAIRDEARAFAATQAELPLDRLLAFDSSLKARGINPGTSADLTVATLFAVELSNVLRERPDSG